MGRLVYVNGGFLDESEAKVSVFDRGLLFGDGVYEVSAVLRGRLIDNERHLTRLEHSLDGLGIRTPAQKADIARIQEELVERNHLDEGLVYLQVTRGAAERDFAIDTGIDPTLLIFTQERPLIESPLAARGARVVSVLESRWARRNIKTIQLLAATLAKQEALDKGYDDAWFVEDGFVTEGTSSNVFLITQEGTVVTRMLGSEMLAGITRRAVLEIAEERGVHVDERPFTIENAQNAAEAFFSSATALITPVVNIDDTPVGSGTPGPVTSAIRTSYLEKALDGELG